MIQHKQQALQFVSYLSPLLDDTYNSIATYIGEQVGLPVTLSVGQSLDDFATGKADIGFLSGVLYALMEIQSSCLVELVAVPVLQGARYRGTPLSFSDVLVRKESPYTSFQELRGCVWAYTETSLYSAYNLVRHRLLRLGLPADYFRWVMATGSQSQSLQAIVHGHADATAIDSYVLDVLRQKQPELLAELRVIDVFGPPQISPAVVSTTLEPSLRQKIKEAFLSMHQNSQAARQLPARQIERFVSIAGNTTPGYITSSPKECGPGRFSVFGMAVL